MKNICIIADNALNLEVTNEHPDLSTPTYENNFSARVPALSDGICWSIICYWYDPWKLIILSAIKSAWAISFIFFSLPGHLPYVTVADLDANPERIEGYDKVWKKKDTR